MCTFIYIFLESIWERETARERTTPTTPALCLLGNDALLFREMIFCMRSLLLYMRWEEYASKKGGISRAQQQTQFFSLPLFFSHKIIVCFSRQNEKISSFVRSCMKFCEKKVEKNREWGEQNTQKELALSSRSPRRYYCEVNNRTTTDIYIYWFSCDPNVSSSFGLLLSKASRSLSRSRWRTFFHRLFKGSLNSSGRRS